MIGPIRRSSASREASTLSRVDAFVELGPGSRQRLLFAGVGVAAQRFGDRLVPHPQLGELDGERRAAVLAGRDRPLQLPFAPVSLIEGGSAVSGLLPQ